MNPFEGTIHFLPGPRPKDTGVGLLYKKVDTEHNYKLWGLMSNIQFSLGL